MTGDARTLADDGLFAIGNYLVVRFKNGQVAAVVLIRRGCNHVGRYKRVDGRVRYQPLCCSADGRFAKEGPGALIDESSALRASEQAISSSSQKLKPEILSLVLESLQTGELTPSLAAILPN